MRTNVGNTDRVIRLVLAAVAAVLGLVVGAGSVLGILFFVVAAIMLGTAAVGFCPIYGVLGLSSCKVRTH